MTDQQKCPNCGGHGTFVDPPTDPCPACNGTGKTPAEKLAATVPGQEPLVVPDSVIEEADMALSDAFTGLSREQLRQARVAFAEVIAAWATEQERERIKRLVAAESGQARKDYNSDPQAYYRGVEDGMENLLAALDREEDQ